MAGVDKIVEKMKTQPKGIRFDEGAKVLEHYGYHHVRTNGSHYHFRNQAGDLTTIKYSNPLKISYVTDILTRIGQ
ncbi:MAG: type II toxin-antitoxin system HicA family toxin [Clostridiales bacterium]|nr:type II toxin-antitoxin system HicA family toxin [Clostridiales bacterium]